LALNGDSLGRGPIKGQTKEGGELMPELWISTPDLDQKQIQIQKSDPDYRILAD
jgi:hypothetical protein